MKQLTIRDNSQSSKSQFSEIPGLTAKIADKTLSQLEKEGLFVFPEVVDETDDITGDQWILQGVNDSYHTGNVMGFLGYGDERLIISSRFSSGKDDFFFQYMLDRVMDFPNIINLDTDSDQDTHFFHLLLFLFPQYLKKAIRKGFYKTYIRRRYNDGNVKGTIDIARHIKENTPFTGRIAYSQREYSFDNDLTELIRHTIEFIRKKPYGHRLLAKAKDEANLIIDATPGFEESELHKIIIRNTQNTIRHAYYREYRNLQHLCLLILQHQNHTIGTGSRRIYGILFDGAWLWEEYVNQLVDDYFYHPMNKARKGTQELFSGNVGKIYPDFIGKDDNQRIIADAKYKPIGNIGSNDYLQVLAYMFRFDAKRGYYFYPEAAGTDDRKLWLNKGSTYENNVSAREDISLTKHGLKIPEDAATYDSFLRRMHAYESEFSKVFVKQVE